MAEYDARTDSSPSAGAKADGPVILVVKDGACACGCGQSPKGSKRSFLQGHDAKLRGTLGRAKLHGRKVVVNGKSMTPDAVAKDHGFEPSKGTAKRSTSKGKASKKATSRKASSRVQKAKRPRRSKSTADLTAVV